jgi:hypothetical protein
MEDKNGVIYMKSFRASGMSRGMVSGEVATIEYRIPEYKLRQNIVAHRRMA